jgi:hypothetical protein
MFRIADTLDGQNVHAGFGGPRQLYMAGPRPEDAHALERGADDASCIDPFAAVARRASERFRTARVLGNLLSSHQVATNGPMLVGQSQVTRAFATDASSA